MCLVGKTQLLDILNLSDSTVMRRIEDMSENVRKQLQTIAEVCDTLRELSLPWEKLASVTTNGAKSMVEHKTGVIGLINSHMDDIEAKSDH